MKRREALKLVTIAGIGPNLIRAQASDPPVHSHHVLNEGAPPPEATGPYKPSYFSPAEYQVVSRLADLIIPHDGTPGALAAHVPEYIDRQVADMPDMQVTLSGGIKWLDHYCSSEFGNDFIHCTEAQQKTVLDRLATRDVAPGLGPGRSFFVRIREFTCDGFYSSKLGFQDVGYEGNTVVTVWHGCTHPEHGA